MAGRALIIAWAFPPAQVIGAVRPSKLALYLRDEGWDTRVLTAAPELLPFPQGMPVELPEEDIVRVRYRDPFVPLEQRVLREHAREHSVAAAGPGGAAAVARPLRRFLKPLWRLFPLNQVRLPDRSVFWYRPAIAAGKALGREWRPDVIWSTHGPAGSHVVASRLQRHFGVPWVADFRDPWTGNHGLRYPGAIEAAERHVERAVLRRASVITTVSDQLAAYFQRLHGKRAVTIFNGYDANDYASPVEPDAEFRITFTGLARDGASDPSALFAALQKLRLAGDVDPVPGVHFVGASRPSYLLGIAEKYGVQDLVKVSPSVPFRESVKLQQRSSVLLMITWSGPSPGGLVSGKLLEYLGAGRAVLAIGPHDAGVSDILEQTGAGRWSNDADELASILREWIAMHRRTGRVELAAKRDVIAQFSRQEQARRLAMVFAEVTAHGG